MFSLFGCLFFWTGIRPHADFFRVVKERLTKPKERLRGRRVTAQRIFFFKIPRVFLFFLQLSMTDRYFTPTNSGPARVGSPRPPPYSAQIPSEFLTARVYKNVAYQTEVLSLRLLHSYAG